MKTIKTALSLLLMLCMLCSLATAAFADGDGGVVNNDNIGGVTGGSDSPTVTNVYNTGSVTGGDAQPPAAPAADATAPTLNAGVSVTADAVSGTSVEVNGIDIAIVPDQANWVPGPDGVNIEYNNENPSTVNIGGSISAGTYQDGVTISNSGGSVTVNVGTENSPAGVTADKSGLVITQNDIGSKTVVKAGDVNAGTDGIYAPDIKGELTVYVQDINSDGSAIIVSSNNGAIKLNAGDITTSPDSGTGLLATDNMNSIELSVGDIKSNNMGVNMQNNSGTIKGAVGNIVSEYHGITAGTNSGDVTVQAGSITAARYGIFASSAGTDSSTVITASGDVKGDSRGIVVRSSGKKTEITVGSVDENGTVTGATVTGGIELGSGVTAESNTSVTVWKADKIEGDESVIQKVINYIVGWVKPAENEGTLSFTTEKGKTVDGMAVAQEDETITLNITAKDGYVIDKVYYNDDTVIDAVDGNFFQKVLRGGGIKLRAIFKPKTAPKPAAAAADLSVNVVSCTFDLAGGTLDGETGKVVKWFVPGATVKLPAAPTKDGFTFAGWQTKVGDEVKVFQAGDKFTVTVAQDFTALWD